jgi:hypothetical protein
MPPWFSERDTKTHLEELVLLDALKEIILPALLLDDGAGLV